MKPLGLDDGPTTDLELPTYFLSAAICILRSPSILGGEGREGPRYVICIFAACVRKVFAIRGRTEQAWYSEHTWG